MTSWQNLVEPIRLDRERGASQLYGELLNALRTYLTHLKDAPIDLADLAHKVTEVRPEMAPFHFAARRLTEIADPAVQTITGAAVFELLDRLELEISSAGAGIATLLHEKTDNCNSLMLHSYSGTLKAAITTAVARDVQLLISEAKPDREGLKLARELTEAGFSVTTFADEDTLAWLPGTDAVVVGADWIAEEFFVNKIGTGQLAVGANKHSIPFYVVTDFTKLAPARFRPPAVAYEIADLFEEIPSRLVTAFLLPDRARRHHEIPRLLY